MAGRDIIDNMKPKQIAIIAIVLGFIAFIVFAPDGRNNISQQPAQSSSRLTVGQTTPEFNLADTEGRMWKLSDLRGSVVLINFWATWCPPCRSEMPSINGLFKKTLESQDINIITILYSDSPEAAKAYFKENGFSMPILLDPSGEVANQYGLTGVPETFILDKQGLLLKHIVGPAEFDTPNAFDYFTKLMAQK